MQAKTDEPCRLLEWDTAFWGMPVAHVVDQSLTEQRLRAVDDWCQQRQIRCLYFLARVDDPVTTQMAESGEFHLVDVRVSIRLTNGIEERELSRIDTSAVRPTKEEDLPQLEAIAASAHHDTRFYYDLDFPRADCDRLYATWVRRSYEGYADGLLTAEVDGEPVGYMSFHIDKTSRIGHFGLLGVQETVRRQGIGRSLVIAALKEMSARDIHNVTGFIPGRNTKSQRLYTNLGFLIEELQLWYHKWYR